MGDIQRGFPSYCRCGTRVSRFTSKTTSDPGRLFHKCPYGDENNRYHLFKWTDVSMVEEIEDMKERLDILQAQTSANAKGLQACQSDMETLTAEAHSSFSLSTGAAKELLVYQDDIQAVKMELRSLKNMVVCVTVFALFYMFFM